MTGGKRTFYMGIDIASGSPQGSRRPKYSVVIVNGDGRPVLVNPSVPLSRVIRLAWDYRPVKIGLDNPLELAAGVGELEKILSLFPPESEIVQVNLSPDGRLQKLKTVAREHGLEAGKGKLSSVKTAFIAAYLAKEGEGTPIRSIEEKTIIIVSKARSPRGGGFSQQRLQRRVRASVHIAAMKVKEALDKAGIEYDMHYRRSVGGLEQAVFTVYAPRTRLYGLVRPHRGLDYTITVKTIYKSRLNVASDSRRPDRPVIVGVDPGVTTGVAVLDLNGKPIYLASIKGIDRGSIIEEISGLGRPVMFAVDVSEVPESVRWIAAKFNAPVYSPPADLDAAEKREIATRILGRPPVDTHQRDALAAAYKAFQLMRRKLEHVEHELSKMGVEIDVDKVKESVVRGVTLAEAIERAIDDVLGEKKRSGEGDREVLARNTENRGEPDYQYLVEKIERLEAERRILEDKIRELERRVRLAELEAASARRQVRLEILKDEEVRRLRERARLLESRINELEERLEHTMGVVRMLEEVAVKLQRGDLVLLRRLSSLTPRSIRKSEEVLGPLLPGEIIFLPRSAPIDREALGILAEASIHGVIAEDEKSADLLVSYGIPAIPSSRVPGGVESIAGLLVAPGIVTGMLEDVAREIEERKRAELDLERLIREYRSARRANKMKR